MDDAAIAIDAHAWLAGGPPDAWTYRDAVVARFNEASHEHHLTFSDHERTARWFRLDHFQILDWDVLPRRRAAMLAPRAAVTIHSSPHPGGFRCSA